MLESHEHELGNYPVSESFRSSVSPKAVWVTGDLHSKKRYRHPSIASIRRRWPKTIGKGTRAFDTCVINSLSTNFFELRSIKSYQQVLTILFINNYVITPSSSKSRVNLCFEHDRREPQPILSQSCPQIVRRRLWVNRWMIYLQIMSTNR